MAQDALGESESRYRELVELSPDAIFVHAEGEFLFVNSAAVKLFGATTPDELIGTSAYDVIHREYRALAEGRARQVAAGGEPPFTELKVRRRDGSTVVVEVIAKRATYQGRPAILSIHRDVSERKQAEETLRLTQFALDHAGDAAIWLDRDGHVVYANAASCELLGYSRDELLTLSVSNYDPDVSPDDFVRAFERPDPITFEARHRTKNREGRAGRSVHIWHQIWRCGDHVQLLPRHLRAQGDRGRAAGDPVPAARHDRGSDRRHLHQGCGTAAIKWSTPPGPRSSERWRIKCSARTTARFSRRNGPAPSWPRIGRSWTPEKSGSLREVVVEDGVERVLLTTKGPCRDADGALTGTNRRRPRRYRGEAGGRGAARGAR